MMPKKIYSVNFCLTAIAFILLTLYSFSQIDLNLTLSGYLYYQKFQNMMIGLGYYRRPLSAAIYLILLVLIFLTYLKWLKLIRKYKISRNQLKWLLLIIVLAGIFSYPAFSHDIFNYLFDARIVTKYHLNPYVYSALDFPRDLWTRFMHWTHRTYPYGPVWLAATIPFSFIGFQKFVLTLLSFKFLFVLIYSGNLFLIGKITASREQEFNMRNMLYFGLNPLVIIESLISPHNESLMLFFLLLFFYYYWSNKKGQALMFLGFSVLVKYLTGAVIPLLFIPVKKLKENREFFLTVSLAAVALLLLYQIYIREAYPWYFLTIIGIISLITNSYLRLFAIVLSFSALLRYVPFIYYGRYDQTALLLTEVLFLLPLALIVTLPLFKISFKR